jgi:tetratricopeptide (TPR) repeat protein
MLLVGFLFALFIGGLSLLRREPLSGQFALETTIITLVASGMAALMRLPVDFILLILFVVILYLITMRVRLLVDVGNLFARRKKFALAERFYSLAMRLWPEPNLRLLVRLNCGVLALQRGSLDEAITLFKELLRHAEQEKIGIKLEAALHYNLGIAYQRKNLDPQAVAEFNLVVDTWPLTEFARRASALLAQGRQKIKPPTSTEDMPDQ